MSRCFCLFFMRDFPFSALIPLDWTESLFERAELWHLNMKSVSLSPTTKQLPWSVNTRDSIQLFRLLKVLSSLLLKWTPAAAKIEHPAHALWEQPSRSVYRVFPCRLASDGHAQLLLGRGFLFCLPFIANASSQPFPLFQPMPHFATQALMLFLHAPLPPTPYPSLCDWLLFDNWPLLVLLFEPTIV